MDVYQVQESQLLSLIGEPTAQHARSALVKLALQVTGGSLDDASTLVLDSLMAAAEEPRTMSSSSSKAPLAVVSLEGEEAEESAKSDEVDELQLSEACEEESPEPAEEAAVEVSDGVADVIANALASPDAEADERLVFTAASPCRSGRENVSRSSASGSGTASSSISASAVALGSESACSEPGSERASGSGLKRPIGEGAEFFVSVNSEEGSKKSRKGKTSAEAGNFLLRGNPDSQPAPNPPLLKNHPLREDQRRSLAWMQERESLQGNHVRGGVLADKMGYGKTATAIGLISLGLEAARQDGRACQPGYLPCQATLIMSPSHLIEQWKGELRKFLGSETVNFTERGAPPPRGGVAPHVSVLVLTEAYMLNGITGNCLADFDIVLASYKVQATASYAGRLKRFMIDFGVFPNGWVNNGMAAVGVKVTKVKNCKMSKKMELLREHVSKWSADKKAEAMKRPYPILELFWWDRIIMDEFHESESWVYRVTEMFKSIGAHRRWGLSGTPPVGNIQSIQQVAAILWHGQDIESHSTAQTFLDCCVLQNSSAEVEAIVLEEHVELVNQTQAERAIYRQACHDLDIFDLEQGYEATTLKSRETLLKCCAHFACQAGRRVAESSAQQELERLGDRKQQRIKDVQNQFWLEAARAQALGCWPACQEELQPNKLASFDPSVADFVQKMLAEAAEESVLEMKKPEAFAVSVEHYTQDGELRAVPKVFLQQSVSENDVYPDPGKRHVAVHYIARKCNREAAALLEAQTSCTLDCHARAAKAALPEAITRLLVLLDEALRSLRFFKVQLQSIQGDVQSRTCSICLEEDCELSSLCILPCGHLFHTSCVKDVLRVQQFCPECRSPVKGSDISSLQLELKVPTKQPSEPQLCREPTVLQRAHGSKLSAVAEALLRLHREDALAKALVFVQWVDLEWRVADALRAYGVPFLQLPRRSGQNIRILSGEVLQKFQELDSPHVIILSLERAAAGANLTRASHVFFVHPMNAETSAVAVAYEKQAIGRVRRIGQTRSKIHVHRFIARGTVEEHISQLHQHS
eukprot:TRINITY_DN78293_c0_g1_i1.p1 TRINITY_DN78293_c0_g1~~TRINITY_DN78293_c0_g1_i1.p1  ORF type:complete len:1051 (-),score=236.34 TRINITY_DN78293_c0_g1_i1:44-3169(-)